MFDFGGQIDHSLVYTKATQQYEIYNLPQKNQHELQDFTDKSPLVTGIDEKRLKSKSVEPYSPSNEDIIKLEQQDYVQSSIFFEPKYEESKQVNFIVQQSFFISKSQNSKTNKYPKNIIKNFMVQFQNFLLLAKVPEELLHKLSNTFGCKPSSVFNHVSKIQKFIYNKKKISNARQLQSLLSVPGARVYFIYFLENQAQNWIEKSNKLQLKQLHKCAIPYLILAAETGQKVRFPIKEWISNYE